MVRFRSIWLPLLMAAALLAGCGSSSSSSSSSGTTAGTTAATSGSTSSSSTSGTGATTLPDAGAAVASCKQQVQRLPQLPTPTKERLEKICEKAGSGDKKAVREAAEEGCRAIVNASPLPSGSAKERALRACAHAGGTESGK